MEAEISNDAVASQAMARPPDLGRGKEGFSPSKGEWSCQHFDVGLRASKTLEYVFIALSHQV